MHVARKGCIRMLTILLLLVVGAIVFLYWDSIEKTVKEKNILNVGIGVIIVGIPLILLVLLLIHVLWPLVVAGIGVTIVANTLRCS